MKRYQLAIVTKTGFRKRSRHASESEAITRAALVLAANRHFVFAEIRELAARQ